MSDAQDSNNTLANVDDAVGFMAAARAVRQKQAAEAAEAAAKQAAADQEAGLNTLPDDFLPEEEAKDGGDGFADFQPQNGDTEKPTVDGDDFMLPQTVYTETGDEFAPVQKEDTVSVPVAVTPPSPTPAPTGNGEDREHETTFKSWGVPETRDKPAARVRHVMIKALPTALRVPAKVLSLIHGGAIETIHISPSGNARVLFCEPEACRAFYDKYPNGIDINKERGQTVFVEMGSEVDVVSSQLLYNLSVGASRVVRAVGVDMNITMGQLLKISSMQNRKVEKILDNFVPGDARNVIFRFCSIDEAVRFRSMLIRDPDWEHCNVQYVVDPCEVATGVHLD